MIPCIEKVWTRVLLIHGISQCYNIEEIDGHYRGIINWPGIIKGMNVQDY